MKKIYTEIGIGNDSFFSTEIEDKNREIRIKRFFLPKLVTGIYIRIWVLKKEFKKPVLGICAGMQIIGLILGKELIKNKRIGVFDNKYYLHSFSFKKDELKENNFTGYIYHPEVLN